MTMKMLGAIHPDAAKVLALRGMVAQNTEMEKHVGRRVWFKNPEAPVEFDNFTVVGVQRIWDGSLAYRVVGDGDKHKFGRPAVPSKITFKKPGSRGKRAIEAEWDRVWPVEKKGR